MRRYRAGKHHMDAHDTGTTAIDTQPLNFVIDPAPASDDHAGTADDDLADTLTRVVDAFCWAVDGPRVAALAVLGQPAVRDALAAADVVRALDREHQPRRWSDESDTVVCDVCQRAWPCAVRSALDGR
jgi:hypothetical protein